MRFVDVTLAAPLNLRDFYGETLGLAVDENAIVVGETRLRFRIEDGGAFYHFALLVPGDRFDAALAWADGRVELLGDVFDFDFWNARAIYFHDPAGNIVELIAHHGLDENGRSGGFDAEELVGFSELGLVGDAWLSLDRELLRDTLGMLSDRDRRVLELRYALDGGEPQTLDEVGRALNLTRERIREIEDQTLEKVQVLCAPAIILRQLEAIGLELWDGTVGEPDGLGFVGERGRTLILARRGRGWLPTGRPAELHPVTAVLEAPRASFRLARDGFEARRRA